MHLLVSAADAADAAAALAGGATIVDAKDPAGGALGAVTLPVLREIVAAVGRARPVTAALGDAATESVVEAAAREAAAAGAELVKIGFTGVTDVGRATALAAAAVRGARGGSGGSCGVIVVGYADAERVGSLPYGAMIDVAAGAQARGVLVDTALKDGPGTLALLGPGALAAWIATARGASLLVAVAGRLAAADLATVRALGADVAGVRGAACDGGRGGRVSAARVRALLARCGAEEWGVPLPGGWPPLVAAKQ